MRRAREHSSRDATRVEDDYVRKSGTHRNYQDDGGPKAQDCFARGTVNVNKAYNQQPEDLPTEHDSDRSRITIYVAERVRCAPYACIMRVALSWG
jgi:hypothetical protein